MISNDLVVIEQVSRQLLLVILNASLKGLLIILCVYLLLSFSKKTSARTLHFVWFLSIAGFIILPFLSFLTPSTAFGSIRVPENPGRLYQTISSVAAFNQTFIEDIPIVTTLVNPGISSLRSTSAGFHWTLFSAIWLTGVVTAFLRTIIGNIRALKIVQQGSRAEKSEIPAILPSLKKRSNVKTSVRILLSAHTGSPFTIGVFNPVVVLPENMKSWPQSDLEPILLHELHHIKRRDYLTQTAAMAICSLFWFVPAIWIALRKLYVEQENACDAEVVRNGINPRHYVNQMVRIACSLLRPAASPGLFMINGRQKLFETRIINILEKRGAIMKKKTLVLVAIGFTLVLSLLAGCITAHRAISEEDFFTSWSGTWVNPEIEGSVWIPEKIVAHPDGGYDIFVNASADVPFCNHDIELIDQWTDAKGVIWYKAYGFCPLQGIEGYMHGKISNSGNTLEFLYNMTKEPIEKWEPDKVYDFYCKFYREL